MSKSLIDEVKRVLALVGVDPDSQVVVSVSGGPDSLALLHVLKGLMSPGSLHVGHLNHQLRNEAHEEAAFVAHISEDWKIPARIATVDVAKLAEKNAFSVEEAARQARYDFLEQLATELGAKFIVVAHHADDQIETVFLNLLRGTGLTGLRGMEAVRPLSDNSEQLLVRPFLFISRSAIERYCHEHHLQPKFDSSNLDTAYRRNYLRHDLLPRIRRINPQFNRHLLQLVDLARVDDAYLEELTIKAWDTLLVDQGPDWCHLNRGKWLALPLSLQRRTLRHGLQLLRSSSRDVSFRAIDLAIKTAGAGKTGAKVNLPGGLNLWLAYDLIVLGKGESAATIDLPQMTTNDDVVQLPIPGSLMLADGWEIKAEISSESHSQILQNPDPWCAFVDVGDCQELLVRCRSAGERMQPLGMSGRSTSIQDLMVNIKLPAHVRSRWPIVSCDNYPVWLVGFYVDERAKVKETSTRVIKLSCAKISE